jgi:hypothetical protein
MNVCPNLPRKRRKSELLRLKKTRRLIIALPHVHITIEERNQSISTARTVPAGIEDTAFLNACVMTPAPFAREAATAKNRTVAPKNASASAIKPSATLTSASAASTMGGRRMPVTTTRS